MEDYLKSAIEIVTAQANARAMTADEITSMITKVSAGIQAAANSDTILDGVADISKTVDAKKSIKESSITCLECGKSFKIITRKHLANHDLTPEEYREKYGFKKGTALSAKLMVRERRKKMLDMRLWERRTKPAATVQQRGTA